MTTMRGYWVGFILVVLFGIGLVWWQDRSAWRVDLGALWRKMRALVGLK